eukprot:GHVN01093985.1.p1 GENE.GHVN01093985.1~~GHVN01093985.1.p1  ORF type:complete len:917 (-),score=126.62 GHVN01093985.1:142-2892(-)
MRLLVVSLLLTALISIGSKVPSLHSFVKHRCEGIDGESPPDYLRLRVDSFADDGTYFPRTLVLYKVDMRYEYRVWRVDGRDEVTEITSAVDDLRTYRGWSEEDSDGEVAATLLKTGELRWNLFKSARGLFSADEWFTPESLTDPNAAITYNYDIIYQGDDGNDSTRQDPSADPIFGGSWTSSDNWENRNETKIAPAFWWVSKFEWEKLSNAFPQATVDELEQEFVNRILHEFNMMQVVFRRELLMTPVPRDIYIAKDLEWRYDGQDDIKYVIGKENLTNYDVGFLSGWRSSSYATSMFNPNKYTIEHNKLTIDGFDEFRYFEWLGRMMGATVSYSQAPWLEGETIMHGRKIQKFSLIDRGHIELAMKVSMNQGDISGWSRMRSEDVVDQGYQQSRPVAVMDHVEVDPGNDLWIDLLGNDIDADGDDIAIHSIGLPKCMGCVLRPILKSGDRDRDMVLFRSNERVGNERIEYTIVDKTGRTGSGLLWIQTIHKYSLVYYLDFETILPDDEKDFSNTSPFLDMSLNNWVLTRASVHIDKKTPFGRGLLVDTSSWLMIQMPRINNIATWTFWVKLVPESPRDSVSNIIETKWIGADYRYWYANIQVNAEHKLGFKFGNEEQWLNDLPILDMSWHFVSLTMTDTSVTGRVIKFEDAFKFTDSHDDVLQDGGGNNTDEHDVPARGEPCTVATQVIEVDYLSQRERSSIDTARWTYHDSGHTRIGSTPAFFDEVKFFDCELDEEEVIQIARHGDGQVLSPVNPFQGAVIWASRAGQIFDNDDKIHEDDDDDDLIENVVDELKHQALVNSVKLEWPPTAQWGTKKIIYKVFVGSDPDAMEEIATTEKPSYRLMFNKLKIAIVERIVDEETHYCYVGKLEDVSKVYWCVEDQRSMRSCTDRNDRFRYVHFFTLKDECDATEKTD